MGFSEATERPTDFGLERLVVLVRPPPPPPLPPVPTVIVTVAGLLVRPRESVPEYVNVAVPLKPAGGV